MANRVTVNEEVCKGCGLCTSVCPKKIMIIDRDKLNAKGYNPATVSNIELCIACAMCAIMCPDSAIKVEKE
ncbi:MAG: indolepyruvate ferredoxin oxidoreductase subunit alpha [Oscillospiraceae bacterium]|jgi:2-oxoglutarate ferredoxin oxidoreductase subunit delta